MAPKDQIDLALGENAAFGKLTQACRHGIEAAVEIGTYRSDPRWNRVAMVLEKVLLNVIALHRNHTKTIIQGVRRQ